MKYTPASSTNEAGASPRRTGVHAAAVIGLCLLSASILACGADSELQAPQCEEGLHFADLLSTRPSRPFEYASLRLRGEGSSSHYEYATFGRACQNAVDPGACEADLASVETRLPFTKSACLPACSQMYLVTTTQGRVEAWGSIRDILALLGPIDTPSEAVFVASYQEYDVNCAALDTRLVREVDGGYELQATVMLDSCPVRSGLVNIRVQRGGGVIQLDTPRPLPSEGPDLCI